MSAKIDKNGKKESKKPKIFITNFNPNRCNICYNNAVNTTLKPDDSYQNIKYCTACKLVGYCSQEHQSLDWKIHKEMCRAIVNLMKEKKIEHILDINRPIKNASKKDFEEAIIVIKYLLVGILKRQLFAFEEKMITFPKVCNECYEYDTKKLEECKSCHNFFFCCDKHNNADEHKAVCEELRLEYMLTTAIPFHDFFYEVPEFRSDIPPTTLPANLCDLLALFIDHTVPTLPNPAEYTNEDFQKFLIISKFSNVATALYAMTKVKPLDQYEQLQIHVVGTEKDKINFNRSACALLFALLPNVSIIELVFCGPHLADDKAFEKYDFDDNREVLLYSSKSIYQYYLQIETAKKHPNLIMAYNCGFSEYTENPELNSWPDGIARMLQFKNVPIVFTSFTRNESVADYNVFVQQAEKMGVELEFLVKNTTNPYRDVRPLRNWEITSGEEIYYVNNYIHVVKARNCDF